MKVRRVYFFKKKVIARLKDDFRFRLAFKKFKKVFSCVIFKTQQVRNQFRLNRKLRKTKTRKRRIRHLSLCVRASLTLPQKKSSCGLGNSLQPFHQKKKTVFFCFPIGKVFHVLFITIQL